MKEVIPLAELRSDRGSYFQRSYCLECIDYVGDFRLAVFQDNTDNIKADLHVEQIIARQIVHRGAADLALLVSGHRLDRIAEMSTLTGFDFDKDTGAAVSADDIDFTAFLTVVA